MSQQDHKDFFISYNGADQRWAEWIAWQLEEASYAVILQAWDFLPGSNFVVQMDRALTLAPRLIAVLSPPYLSALYTQPEWAAAFRRDPKGEQSLLIPVRVQPCEVTGLLGPIVYVDLVGQDEATARQRLLAAVRHERAKPAQAPAFPQTMQHTISKQLNYPGDLPLIWKMPHQRDPLFLGREQLLQELHTTLATDHHVLLFEPASEREAGTSGAIETAVEYAYRYRSDYQVIAWIEADTREALRSDLLSLAAELHLPQTNLSDQDALTAVIQWLQTHQNWLLILDQVQEKEVLAPLMPLPQQGHLLMVTSTRSLESLAPLLELSQVPWEERTVLAQLSQVVGELQTRASVRQEKPAQSLLSVDHSNAVLFDEAHGQSRWKYPMAPTIDDGYMSIKKLTQQHYTVGVLKEAVSAIELRTYAAFVLPIGPEGLTYLKDEELDAIRDYVRQGGGLLVLSYYTGDWHHEANLNEVLDSFGITFINDVVMPKNATTVQARSQLFKGPTDSDYLVMAQPATDNRATNRMGEELLANVRQVATVSSCSLSIAGAATAILRSGSESTQFVPKPTGKGIVIAEYKKTGRGSAVLVGASKNHKVIAVGSWKTFLNEFIDDPNYDNRSLYENMLSWLMTKRV
jgi:hypothetical protein